MDIVNASPDDTRAIGAALSLTHVVSTGTIASSGGPHNLSYAATSMAGNDNDSTADNNSSNATWFFPADEFDNPFNYPFVKFLFITLYSIVFLVCCIGNSLVLYTIGRNKRMRTRTNFFLANLAVADLSVGIVCVLPKLSTFISPYWILGEAMCKIYYFAQSMTYTASILLLTAIAIERYIAIIHPFRSRCLVTQNRLIFAQVFIWLLSAAYNAPELSMFNIFTISNNNETATFCFLTDPYANIRDYYTINFVLWYILPLGIMTFMYLRVACTLMDSSGLKGMNDQTTKNDVHMKQMSTRDRSGAMKETVICYDAAVPGAQTHTMRGLGLRNSYRQSKSTGTYNNTLATLVCGAGEASSKEGEEVILNTSAVDLAEFKYGNMSHRSLSQESRNQSMNHQNNSHHHHKVHHHSHKRNRRYLSCDFTTDSSDPTSSEEYDMLANNIAASRRVRCQYRINYQRVLSSRRRVIRLLVVVLLTFAVCVFPHHLKLMLMFWHVYPTPDTKLDVLSPFAFVMLYANSALNPILYWVFSDAFRKSFKDSCRRGCIFQYCKRSPR